MFVTPFLSMQKKSPDDIDGWLTEKEGNLLHKLAKNSRGAIVEIGSWKGKSTIELAKGSKAGNNAKIYAIDPHTGSQMQKQRFGKIWTFDEFKKNIKNAGVDDVIVPLVKTSKEAARNFDKPVQLIFIDGDHDYEMVKLDFDLWYPKVSEGGIMALHDTVGWSGPQKVAEESLYKSRNFRNVRFVDSITYAEKVSENSAIDRLGNRFSLFLKNLCGFAYRVLKQ